MKIAMIPALLLAGLSMAAQADDSVSAPASAADTASKTTPVPEGQSRIRVFGQNGATVKVYPNSACVRSFWSDDKITVAGSVGQAFASFVGASSNVVLGMPETETTRHLADKNGIFSKAYYHELAVPGNKPTTLSLFYPDTSLFYRDSGASIFEGRVSCGGSLSFVPEAGADYEVGFHYVKDGCIIQILQIQDQGNGKAPMDSVPLKGAGSC